MHALRPQVLLIKLGKLLSAGVDASRRLEQTQGGSRGDHMSARSRARGLSPAALFMDDLDFGHKGDSEEEEEEQEGGDEVEQGCDGNGVDGQGAGLGGQAAPVNPRWSPAGSEPPAPPMARASERGVLPPGLGAGPPPGDLDAPMTRSRHLPGPPRSSVPLPSLAAAAKQAVSGEDAASAGWDMERAMLLQRIADLEEAAAVRCGLFAGLLICAVSAFEVSCAPATAQPFLSAFPISYRAPPVALLTKLSPRARFCNCNRRLRSLRQSRWGGSVRTQLCTRRWV